MAEERGAPSTLKGRLADVYVRALVEGSLNALSRRLGNRATIDDPLFGRASTLSSIEPLLEKMANHFVAAGATYRHVASTTGVDRDVSEGILVMNPGAMGTGVMSPGVMNPGTHASAYGAAPPTASSGLTELPIIVVAERRRLREIELRVYYASHSPQRRARAPLLEAKADVPVPQIVSHVLEALRKGAVERVLAAFEETSRFVSPTGRSYTKRDGAMADFVDIIGGRIDVVPTGTADNGRTCCIEAIVTRRPPLEESEPAALSFERGDSGLLRELRLYYEP